MRPPIGALLAVLFVAACGGAATPSTAPAPTATAPGTAGPVAQGTWSVGDTSKATVRVREQLVGVSAPSDAVLVATGATGSFTLNVDGTFTSDQRDRDRFIKMDTLRTSQFPKAELVPTKISGTVPASGDFTLTLSGKMTIHGTTKEVTFDVLGKRDGANLTATATANPTWRFADFGMTAPSVPFRVVSLVDEIKVVVDLVATAKG